MSRLTSHVGSSVKVHRRWRRGRPIIQQADRARAQAASAPDESIERIYLALAASLDGLARRAMLSSFGGSRR